MRFFPTAGSKHHPFVPSSAMALIAFVALGARPYLIGEGGTLDERIRQFTRICPKHNIIYMKITQHRGLNSLTRFC